MKNKKNTFKTSEVVFLVVTTCVLSFLMATLIVKNKVIKVNYIEDEYIEKFSEQYNNILDNYYQDVDKDKLIDKAIKGMIESLEDPYATYFNADEAKNFNIKLNGSFEGIGVEIVKLTDGNIGILTVYEDSPAAKQGLKAGDVITKLNGQSVYNITTIQLASFVSENKNTKITVLRNDDELEFELSKGNVIIKSVTSDIIEENNKKIGYIKIDIFALNTYNQLKQELINLENHNINSLIIDLRDNSGGHLSAAEDILSLFLSKDNVIYQMKKNNKIEKFYSKGEKNIQYKIAILVNSNSASASEVMTAALKENLNVNVIGQKTFGKGTAQELITLSSGEQYKFTTKEWLTPTGKSINGVGITPDIEVNDDSLFVEEALKILK